jgi:hypothetical protein
MLLFHCKLLATIESYDGLLWERSQLSWSPLYTSFMR